MRSAAVVALLVVTGAVPALAKTPRDDLFDPSTLGYASCDNVFDGTDAPDQMIAQTGQSLTGFAGDDTLTAAPRTFCLSGGNGNDTLIAQSSGGIGPWADGGPGRDHLVGGPLADLLKGGDGADVISGGAGRDIIDGGAGDDRIDAGAGGDRITGGAGHNRIDAGSGNDLISANDGSREQIDCGPGNDVVHADRGDRLIHCEHVKFHTNPYPHVGPRTGSLTTLFTVGFVAPYTTEFGPGDEGTAGYDYDAIARPSQDCDLLFRDATPFPGIGQRYSAHFKIRPQRAACRGTYRVAVTFENTSLSVECNSREGAQPRTPGNFSDCPFTDTIGYFTFRIG
jgi:hypothetical protein